MSSKVEKKKVEEKVEKAKHAKPAKPAKTAKTAKKAKKAKPAKKAKKAKTAKKAKRPASAYAQFVKLHYKDPSVQAVPPKQRFGIISVLWKKEKEKKQEVQK